MVRRALFVVLGAAVTAVDVGAQDAQKPESLSAAEMVVRGRALYARYCSHCHGFSMVSSGNVSYDLRRFPGNDKPRFVNSVLQGKGGMPPWTGVLSMEQIDQLWAYVVTGGKQ